TVRALETSSVIALSIATLERKLAEDPAFAARLCRAVATLEAERLRTTTAQVRRNELATGQHAPVPGGAAGAGLLDQVGALKKAVAAAEQGGAAEAGVAAVTKAFSALEQSLGSQGPHSAGNQADRLQSELLPLLRLSATG